MSEASTRMFAFERYAARDARLTLAGAGVKLTPRRVWLMWNVRGKLDNAQFIRDAAEAFGVALPIRPNTAAGGDVRALWLGPDEWLVVAGIEAMEPKRPSNATITDVSHGRAVARLSGIRVPEALAKGCALDVDQRVFPVNACAQTAIARINIVLDHIEPGVFDLYCPRSYAASMWHWLTEAASEYGCDVVPTALAE